MAVAPSSPARSRRQRRLTVADYMAMPDDGRKYELYYGELMMSPSAFQPHGRVVIEVGGQLSRWVLRRKLGYVGVETDVVMGDDLVLRPDIHFIARKRRKIIRGHIYGPPDLVIEVTSSENWQFDLYEKRDAYSDFRVREYLVLDIADERNRAFQWNLQGRSFHGGLILGSTYHSRVLKGFKLDLNSIWELAMD